jgi:hypothetical protein
MLAACTFESAGPKKNRSGKRINNRVKGLGQCPDLGATGGAFILLLLFL